MTHRCFTPWSRRLAVGAALCAAIVLAASVRAAQWVAHPSELDVEYSTADPSRTEPASASTESMAAQAAAGDQATEPGPEPSVGAAQSTAKVAKDSKAANMAPKTAGAKPVAQAVLVESALKPNPMASNGPARHPGSAEAAPARPVANRVNESSLADAMDAPDMPPEATGVATTSAAGKVAADDTAARAQEAAASVGDNKPLTTGPREPVAYLQPSAQYLVQPGDVLQITVWKEEDLQREVLVRPDGGLSFPLAGDIVAAGRTVEQIQKDISTRIESYIPEPVVTVAVKQVVGNRVYVVGRVNKPGEIIMGHELTVMQALSLAGGVTPFASLNHVHILRRDNGVERSIPFRYGDVEKGRSLSENIVLQNGDVVVVP